MASRGVAMSSDVAVIIPAANGARTLPQTLRALRALEFVGTVEVIVVDDASTDETSAVANLLGARLVRLDQPAGPAIARNAGVKASSAPLIAFTDADCEPDAMWLQGVVDGLRAADLVTGPVLPDPSVVAGRFDRTLRIAQPSALFETANLGVRRDLFDAIGGFEPFVPTGRANPGIRPRPEQGHFGEDVVFGWRARRLGARIAFREDAVVYHAVFPRGARGYIAEKWRLRYFPALLREVPEFRRALPLRLFLSRRTLRFDVAVVGVATAAHGRRAWPLLLSADYVRRCLRTTGVWRRSAARENLALVVGDVVALSALIRGSIAARRLLL